MKKIHLLKLTVALGVVLMLISFAVVPEKYPSYYEILLFNTGLWPTFFAKRELKRRQN